MWLRQVSAGALAVFLVAGCADKRMDDLQRFVENAHKDRKPRVEPLPRVRPHDTFAYTASQLTDPFSAGNLDRSPPATGSGNAPDITRRKEPLEQYPLDSLRMVGTLSRGETSWAVIRAPDGTIHRAREGNYLGQNYGRVIEVTDSKLYITELIPGGNDNWIERESNIAIVE